MTNPDLRDPIDPMLARQLDAEPDGAALRALWDQLGAAAPTVTVDPEARASMRAALQQHASARPTSPATSPARVGRRWLAAAALLLTGATLWQTVPVSVTADAGARRAITLPDGSAVQLNGGSTLTWARGFRRWGLLPSAARGVRLEGEAFFAVAKDGRPFTVRGGAGTVTVLGTRFSVRAWPSNAMTVDVEEGRVRVAAATGAVEVTEGERTVVRAGAAPTTPATVDAARIAPWRRGGFAVMDEPLAEVLTALAQQQGVPITLRTPAVAARRYTAYYPVPTTLEVILADLCVANGIRYRASGRGFEVY